MHSEESDKPCNSNHHVKHSFFEAGAIRYCIFVYTLWRSVRETYFSSDYQIRTLYDLCIDGYCRKSTRVIVNYLFLRTLDCNLGNQRHVQFTTALRGGIRLHSNAL